MKWWCFDEHHLEAALNARIQAASDGQPPAARESAEAEARAIREFLSSDEARANKLVGGE